jgi:mono/diheme cytochrome c family protein
MRKSVVFGLSVFFILLPAVVVNAQMSAKAQMGRKLFYDPSFGGTLDSEKVSGLACANCHADFDDAANPDGLLRSGHSIVGVPHRGEAKGGMLKGDMFRRGAGGGGFCYEHFLQCIPGDKVNPTNIPAEQAEALMAYFEHVSGNNKGPTFQMQTLDETQANAAADKILAMKADSKRGWQLYARACAVCHGTPKKGGIGPQLVRSRPVPDVEKRKHKIASYVRKGGSVMPFFAPDRLSDQDLADIAAFLGELSK